jgi:calcineurin-like phosphoesterase family protein
MIDSLYDKFKPWSAGGSIYIISDTHFDDPDCKLMNSNWITPTKHMDILKKEIHKNDTLIHLGDVGDASYLDELKCYKVLITGNHDVLSKVASHFDEVYNGPLFIADRILLSHEPIFGLEQIALNIHGHVHNGATVMFYDAGGYFITSHLNLASDVAQFQPCNLKTLIKSGYISNKKNYHRLTIDKATENKNG